GDQKIELLIREVAAERLAKNRFRIDPRGDLDSSPVGGDPLDQGRAGPEGERDARRQCHRHELPPRMAGALVLPPREYQLRSIVDGPVHSLPIHVRGGILPQLLECAREERVGNLVKTIHAHSFLLAYGSSASRST